MRTSFFSRLTGSLPQACESPDMNLNPGQRTCRNLAPSQTELIYICCKVINVFVPDVATDLLPTLTIWVTKTSLLTHFIPKLKHSLSKHCICGKLEHFYSRNVSVLHLLMLPGWSTAVFLLLCPSRNNNRPTGKTGIIWTPSTKSHMTCGLKKTNKNTTVARFILKHISLSGTNFY